MNQKRRAAETVETGELRVCCPGPRWRSTRCPQFGLEASPAGLEGSTSKATRHTGHRLGYRSGVLDDIIITRPFLAAVRLAPSDNHFQRYLSGIVTHSIFALL